MGQDYEFLKVSCEESIGRIALNRPPVNVLNIQMMREINSVLDAFATDEELKLVQLRAEGKAFCAGVDVADHGPDVVGEMISQFDGIFERLASLPVPSMAVVDGAAIGGGCELVAGCDMVIASMRSKFGQPEIRLGFFPPFAAYALPRLVGRNRAMEICLVGENISAERAEAIGLINKAVEVEKFEEEIRRYEEGIRASSPLIIRLAKKAIVENLNKPFPEAMRALDGLFLDELMKTEDTLEGMASFFEKRRPVWKNR
jgi:cyclohexa-1,5-dienecarbonyl-CoA hydratase